MKNGDTSGKLFTHLSKKQLEQFYLDSNRINKNEKIGIRSDFYKLTKIIDSEVLRLELYEEITKRYFNRKEC